MNESQEMGYGRDAEAPAGDQAGGFTETIGRWAIDQTRGLIQFTGLAVAVVRQGLRPLTWRRTLRAEFFDQCYQIGMRALPFILITGGLVGLGIVYQALYWLKLFGQTEFTGLLLVIILVREVAPLFVALTVIGRSGSVILVEIGNMRIDGQIRMLDAQGIDPFLFLVIPRVAAVSVCMFSLTIAFIVVALGSGFWVGNALESQDLTLQNFVFGILAKMEFAEFLTLPLKTLLIGFVVALIACTTGFSVTGSRSELLAALPRGITKSVLATLVISGVLTLLL
jgi:phospholipid/cholesterol/gamma-HCH transport system permease protein